MEWKEYSKNKIISPEQLEKRVNELKQQKKKISTCNGSFDILHAGHLYFLFEAAKKGDILIVALNSDASVQAYKGASRPIIPLKYRIEMLSALAFVDYITWFEESDPREILKKIRPDVHVNGIEYGENCIEADTVREYGGSLHLVDRISGLATSEILKKIIEAHLSCV